MLFLAVFCGFLAENQREHYIEHQREKKYLNSLIEDLKKDTAALQVYINIREIKSRRMDSLINLLVSGQYKTYGNETYFFARHVSRGRTFFYSDGTMQQLKNAGGLRLIRKQKIVDSIMSYDANVKLIQIQDEIDLTHRYKIEELAGEVFNAEVFSEMIESNTQISKPDYNPQLLTNDPITINKMAVLIHYEGTLQKFTLILAKGLIAKAIRLIHMIEKEK